ncbi:MAG: helix-turn-helix transcriptional regulator [Pseudomonadota bacterium]
MDSYSYASEIDRHVGQRIRARRESLRISQGRLGRQLGVTFSQIQKYEKGSNRIGAGRLYQIALFLGVTPNYFFEGLRDDEVVEGSGRPRLGTVSPDEVKALTDAFLEVDDKDTRASVIALVRSLMGEVERGSI